MKKYTFKPYSTLYSDLFSKEREHLLSHIKQKVVIEHVGSTSVPGLGGKGIIDIALLIKKQDLKDTQDQLQKLGYEFRPLWSTPDRLFFRTDLPDPLEQQRRYHIHLMNEDSNEFNDMLAFRDYLRCFPQEAEAYAMLKQQASEITDEEGEKYRQFKEPIFKKVLAKATMRIEELIGNYTTFFQDLVQRLKNIGIDITGMPISHLLYRTETLPEYEILRDKLKYFCKQFVETEFNGRAVAILVLKKPLTLSNGFTVSVIELPAPRSVHMYPSGLESIGAYLGDNLAAFKAQYSDLITGVKDHGPHCQPAFITFDNQKSFKFYDYSLLEIILLQGWRFVDLSLPPHALINKIADVVNSWQWYFHSIDDWKNLINHITPKTSSDLIYDLANPIDRPNETFAIMDLRTVQHDLSYQYIQTGIYFVLQGTGSIIIGEEEECIQKDSTVTISANTPHRIISKKDLVLAVVTTTF